MWHTKRVKLEAYCWKPNTANSYHMQACVRCAR